MFNLFLFDLKIVCFGNKPNLGHYRFFSLPRRGKTALYTCFKQKMYDNCFIIDTSSVRRQKVENEAILNVRIQDFVAT